MSQRRKLSFASLDDVMPEVERLLAGHTTVGRWSLAQICNHLATAFTLVVANRRHPVRRLPWPLRLGKRVVCAGFLNISWFPSGVKVPLRVLVPKEGLDAHKEAESLRKALARFLESPGPFRAHPFLGEMTKEEWVRFHRKHCAHHLGFASPRRAESSTPS